MIYFCEHAVERMFQHGLDPAEVRDALAAPWLSQPATRGRTEHYAIIAGCLVKIITATQKPGDPRNDPNVPIGATVVVTVITPKGNGNTVNCMREVPR